MTGRKSRMRQCALRAWLALAVISGLMQVLPAGPAGASAAGGQVRLSSLSWIFYREDLQRIDRIDPAIVRRMAAGPGLYALEHRAGGRPLPRRVIPAEIFFSAVSFLRAVQHRSVLAGVRFVAADLEDWRATPLAERREPLSYLRLFARAARLFGYRPVLVPGRDLMAVPGAACRAQQGDTISQAYLSCGLPRSASRAAIYVIQAAAVQTSLPALRELVRRGAAQARAANPGVRVIATLSVEHDRRPVPFRAVVRAARSILPYVQGFELNSTPGTDRRVIAFLTALRSTRREW